MNITKSPPCINTRYKLLTMGTKMEDEPTESVGAKVTPSLKRKLRIKAARQDKTMSQFLRELIKESLADCDDYDFGDEN